MKVRDKATRDLVEKLHREGKESKAKFWVAVARGLNRPRKERYEVNLTRIEKHANSTGTVVIPGSVLGSGELSKKVTVAALKFSGAAKEKIIEKGGKCLSIEELYDKNPKGKGLRIMG